MNFNKAILARDNFFFFNHYLVFMRSMFGHLNYLILISFNLHLKYTVEKTNELPKAYI